MHLLQLLIFSFALPLMGINYLLKSIYSLSLLQVFGTYIFNIRAVDGAVGLLLLTFIFLPMFLFPVSGLVSSISLKLFGTNTELVYLGRDEVRAFYLDQQVASGQGEILESSALGAQVRSLKDVYGRVQFVKPPVNNGYAGEAASELTALGFLFKFMFTAFSVLVVITVITAYAGVSYHFLNPDVVKVGIFGTPMAQVFERFAFSQGKYMICLSALLFLSFAVGIVHKTRSKPISYALFLSSEIHPGAELTAIPLSIEEIRTTVTKGSGDQKTSVNKDSGYREVFFKLVDGLPAPAYLAVSLYKPDSPALLASLQELISRKETIAVTLNENYELLLR